MTRRYTKWHEQKPAPTEEEKEKRRAKVRENVKRYRAKVGRPKKYDNEEDRRLVNNERQRKKYRKSTGAYRDVTTQSGFIGAWQDLIDAM